MKDEQLPDLLHVIKKQGIFEEFLSGLGFINANDHCQRNCLHCPAYGDQIKPMNMPFHILEQVVISVQKELTERAMKLNRSILSWRISDPLDYHVVENGIRYSTYDVAKLWKTHLGQGLYLVTNGSDGRKRAHKALADLVLSPELLSQCKLTITPYDKEWGTVRYAECIVSDLKMLLPLWDLQSTRIEDPKGLLFRINVKITEGRRAETSAFVIEVLQKVGYSLREARELIDDEQKIRFKPVYDLGAYVGDSPVPEAIKLTNSGDERFKPTEEERDRYQYAIYPDLSIRVVDMYAFSVKPILADDGKPLQLA